MKAIVLVGPKHCGKSSVGSALKNCFAGGYTDLDSLIEKQNGKTVRELYRQGAEFFRKAEAEAVANILQNSCEKPMLISAGGGIIDNETAMQYLKKDNSIKLIYLEISAENAYSRILKQAKESGSMPPFLEVPNPEAEHRKIHLQRSERYRKIADITIDADKKSIEQIRDQIKALIKNLW
jgi:shikimate kinase